MALGRAIFAAVFILVALISFIGTATTEIIEAIPHGTHLIRNRVGPFPGFLKDVLDKIGLPGVVVAGRLVEGKEVQAPATNSNET